MTGRRSRGCDRKEVRRVCGRGVWQEGYKGVCGRNKFIAYLVKERHVVLLMFSPETHKKIT